MNPNPAHRHILIAAILTLLPALAHAQAPSPRPPNIIFILADDLGYGDLGCYGQQQISTPRIDRLAAEGVRFTDFYAGCTVCAPSRCALMTGLHTGHCYIRGNAHEGLRPQDFTVAEALKKAGYATALIGKWGLGEEGSTGTPNHKGFDHFFGYLDQVHAHNYYPTFLIRDEARVPLRNVVPNEGKFGQGVASQRIDYSPDLFAAEALTFVQANKDKPFFLYYATTIPHANDEAGKAGMEVPELGDYASKDWPAPVKGYAAMVTRLDAHVGALLDKLHELGLDDNTVVFFTSDNGPHHEGGYDPTVLHSAGPLRGGKRDEYEGGIREPMIVRWPGHAPAGGTSHYAGYFPDFLPTAAELAGTASPKDIDGLSFLQAILGHDDQQKAHDYLYWEFYEQGSSQAVRMGDWKGVAKPIGGAVELYNLKDDLGETTDLAGGHPEIAAKLRGIMDEAHVPSPLWKPIGKGVNR